MKLLTRYSRINLLAMVAIFLISSWVLYLLTPVILIREMDNVLGGMEDKVKVYVKQYDVFPQGYPLGEERINFVLTGQQKTERKIEMVQLYSYREKKMHNFRKLAFPLSFHNNWYRVTVIQPIEGLHHLSRVLIAISLTTILVTILISLWLNRVLLRRLWQPFYESLTIMRNFKLGRTESIHFSPTAIEEFSFMNESLLMATEKAGQDYLVLKEFTENASHEIQTPLSIIRSKLDMLIQEKELSEKQSELVKSVYAAIKRLSGLNQSLLLLAKIENQQFNKSRTIDLKEKVEEKILQFQELWQNHHITVACTLQESYLDISPELLDILLNNLFGNATNHNIPSGYISIELQSKRLTVSNTGLSGILDEKRLFTRFYKGAINSNRNGLGLSIIKEISKIFHIETGYVFTDNRHSFILTW